MYQPQILEVDPQRIKFNKLNPRKHGGAEYERLKQSIQEIGIIQPPLVRHTTGIFYEVIDGEGRVSIAQELGMSTINVINVGDVQDEEALDKLVVSNAVRQFDYFARCKGMAAMHRKGITVKQIAGRLGIKLSGAVFDDVGIGYFPDDVWESLYVQETPEDENPPIWSQRMLHAVLQLRIPKVEGDIGVLFYKGEIANLDGIYDYSEVKRAIELVKKGRISSSSDAIRAYVAERRRELFEVRFGKELQERLEAEITSAKQALEDAKALEISQRVKSIETETAQRYQSQITILEAQKTEIEKKYNSALAKVAKGEKAETLEKELEDARRKTEQANKQMQAQMQELLHQEQERQRLEQERQLAAMKAQVEASLKEQREALQREREEARKRQEQEQKQAKADLEAYYKEQDEKRKLKAETSYRQLVASASEHLSHSRQSILNLISQGMIQGIEWLSQEELAGLLFDMRAVRNTLDEAEQSIEQRFGVISHSEPIIESGQTHERSLVNHG